MHRRRGTIAHYRPASSCSTHAEIHVFTTKEIGAIHTYIAEDLSSQEHRGPGHPGTASRPRGRLDEVSRCAPPASQASSTRLEGAIREAQYRPDDPDVRLLNHEIDTLLKCGNRHLDVGVESHIEVSAACPSRQIEGLAEAQVALRNEPVDSSI
jgi:hypothetical protein